MLRRVPTIPSRSLWLYQLPRRNLITKAAQMSSELPPSPIPLLPDVAAVRAWRNKAFQEQKSVGLVPTMGALHEGHLSLVQRSLAENDLTIVSIFVNPAQFAPHEDLATYPRTLPTDIELLSAQSVQIPNPTAAVSSTTLRQPSAIFLPNVKEMYPSGITQDVESQKGTFVEVKGYSHQMEGRTRPIFFRGVATIVTKFFNVVQPTRAYFGQKDIQQALLLRRMTRDLLMSHPSVDAVHIVPTARDTEDGLALSSRNAYLSADGRKVAPTLFQALSAVKTAWDQGFTKVECLRKANEVIEARIRQAREENLDVEMKLDYIEINDADSFEVLEDHVTSKDLGVALLSGAFYVDKTRLIDNLILGDSTVIIS